jgi:hypothetical protein
VAVFNTGRFSFFFRGFKLEGMVFQYSERHKPAHFLEPEGALPCSQDFLLSSYPVPHESSPHFITIYFRTVVLSVPLCLECSPNVT